MTEKEKSSNPKEEPAEEPSQNPKREIQFY